MNSAESIFGNGYSYLVQNALNETINPLHFLDYSGFLNCATVSVFFLILIVLFYGSKKYL